MRRNHSTALPSLAENSLEDKEETDDDSSSYNSDSSISMILRQQNVDGEDKDASGSHSQSDSESDKVLHSSDQPVQQLDQTTDQETLRLLKQKVEELSVMTGKVVLLQQRIKQLVRKNKHLEDLVARNIGAGDSSAVVSRNEVFKSQIVESINTILQMYPRWSVKRTGPLVAQALWNQEVNQPELLKLSRKYFRDTVFTPFNVLREMDLAGGTLSYEGLDILRRVETAGLKRFRVSMIPSKSEEIKRMAAMIEWYA